MALGWLFLNLICWVRKLPLLYHSCRFLYNITSFLRFSIPSRLVSSIPSAPYEHTPVCTFCWLETLKNQKIRSWTDWVVKRRGFVSVQNRVCCQTCTDRLHFIKCQVFLLYWTASHEEGQFTLRNNIFLGVGRHSWPNCHSKFLTLGGSCNP